jgi:hypothetical protein
VERERWSSYAKLQRTGLEFGGSGERDSKLLTFFTCLHLATGKAEDVGFLAAEDQITWVGGIVNFNITKRIQLTRIEHGRQGQNGHLPLRNGRE